MGTAVGVGVVGYDHVVTPAGTYRHQLGGGATFFALAAALFGPARIVSGVGTDFDERDLETLRSRGVDVSGVARFGGATHRWSGRYGADMADAETVANDVGVLARWRPRAGDLRPGDVLYVGSLAPEIQLDVLRAARHVVTIFDTQGHWIARDRARVLGAGRWSGIVCVNEDEVLLLTGRHRVDAAAAWLLDQGPKAIVVKRGARGATLFDGTRAIEWPAFPVRRVDDPTGAGDALAGGMAGHLARSGRAGPDDLAAAVEYGIACASFIAGRAGGRRRPDWSLAAIEERRSAVHRRAAAARP